MKLNRRPHLVDLRQLRYFIAVARERNFTRAAEKLHIAQPPLSRQIQLLEEELGVTLISRATRPLRLTDAGRLFNEQAMQILGRVEQLKIATQRVGKHERRVLSIGFVASTLYSGVPSLVRELRKHPPALELQLPEMMSTQQIEARKTRRSPPAPCGSPPPAGCSTNRPCRSSAGWNNSRSPPSAWASTSAACCRSDSSPPPSTAASRPWSANCASTRPSWTSSCWR